MKRIKTARGKKDNGRLKKWPLLWVGKANKKVLGYIAHL